MQAGSPTTVSPESPEPPPPRAPGSIRNPQGARPAYRAPAPVVSCRAEHCVRLGYRSEPGIRITRRPGRRRTPEPRISQIVETAAVRCRTDTDALCREWEKTLLLPPLEAGQSVKPVPHIMYPGLPPGPRTRSSLPHSRCAASGSRPVNSSFIGRAIIIGTPVVCDSCFDAASVTNRYKIQIAKEPGVA